MLATGLKCVHLKRDCNNYIIFLPSSSLHTVNPRGVLLGGTGYSLLPQAQ